MRHLTLIALLLSSLALSGCSDGNSVQPGPVGGGSSPTLHVVNGTAATVEVRVDGAVRQAALAPYSISPSISTTVGSRTVQLVATGAFAGTAQVVVQTESGARETVAALPGSGLPLLAVTLPDTGYQVGANRSKLRVVHLAAASPPLTIWRTQPDFQTPISIMTPYAYLATAIVESSAGEWNVRVWPTGNGSWTAAAGAIALTIPAGQLRTVATMDAPGGGVQLKVVEP
ncbi:DUF4397 domain-containing protein [Gemmatimonas groenlandica]|uniref:DUF4397 domain-containing protein n=1 Tax=Gemmatimonas groenlandica TaxID=2732249 RepID=A0A6M4IHH3_9BACT|nr:DUF4397 domain-containing protein [Gemmatimonas groenlandica]QJR34030.1 DUF4397 domain-containing protein [Gemmatimonas groenlandica]